MHQFFPSRPSVSQQTTHKRRAGKKSAKPYYIWATSVDLHISPPPRDRKPLEIEKGQLWPSWCSRILYPTIIKLRFRNAVIPLLIYAKYHQNNTISLLSWHVDEMMYYCTKDVLAEKRAGSTWQRYWFSGWILSVNTQCLEGFLESDCIQVCA